MIKNNIDVYEEALTIQQNNGLVSNTVEWDNEKFLKYLKDVSPKEYDKFLVLKKLDK